MITRFCPKCQSEKESQAFYKVNSWCRACYQKEYIEVGRFQQLNKRYGLTKDGYEAMLKKQDGKCAMCGSKNARSKGSNYLVVDHCHKTKRIRGLLCIPCNVSVGHYDVNKLKIEKYLSNIAQ